MINGSATFSGANANYGLGDTSTPTCDTDGTLKAGLLSYWKLDEGTGTVHLIPQAVV